MSFLKKKTQTAIIIFHMLRSKQTCYKFVFLVIAGDVENEDRTVMRLKDLIGHLTVLLCLTSLCLSWARHFTLTVPLSTQVYKWVPA